MLRPGARDPDLDAATLRQLDGLLRALDLGAEGDDRFRAVSEDARFGRHLFGGQLIAQALVAAGRTLEGKRPHSLHAYFVEAGIGGDPVELAVERVRDGRSIATRRVTVTQAGRTLLMAMASFQDGPAEPRHSDPPPPSPPPSPPPEELPTLQDWIREMPPETRAHALGWIERPPPLEIRLREPLNFLGGPCSDEPRVHWLRLPRDVGHDPLLQASLLAYASDYFLMDAALRRHPEDLGHRPFVGASVDHVLWLHGEIRLDRWHRYTQHGQAIAGQLGLVRGWIHDDAGELVASVMQENLLRGVG